MFSWNKKKLLFLAMSVSLMTFSCGKDAKSPMQPQNVNTQQEEAVINDSDFEIVMRENNEMAIIASSDEVAAFHAEFSELANAANSDVKMTTEEIGSGLYSLSFSGDLAAIVDADMDEDEDNSRRRRRRRKKTWCYKIKDGFTGKIHCYSTRKRTRFGARVWFAHHLPRMIIKHGSGSVHQGLRKHGC